MNKLIEILEDINPNVNYTEEKALVTDGWLDSLAIISLVTELEDEFNIDIRPVDIVPENFNAIDKIWKMVQARKG